MIDYFDNGGMGTKPSALILCEDRADFDNPVGRTLVYLGVLFAKVIKNIEAQGSVASTHLIDNHVVVGEVFKEIF